MKAAKQIILRTDIVEVLLHMQKPGMTLSGVIEEMIETEKKKRLFMISEEFRRKKDLSSFISSFVVIWAGYSTGMPFPSFPASAIYPAISSSI